VYGHVVSLACNANRIGFRNQGPSTGGLRTSLTHQWSIC
jgi:hypothetical protein